MTKRTSKQFEQKQLCNTRRPFRRRQTPHLPTGGGGGGGRGGWSPSEHD